METNQEEISFSAAEADALTRKFAAWAVTLTDRERHLLAAAIGSTGGVSGAHDAETEVSGYFTLIELLVREPVVSILIGLPLPPVQKVRDP